MTTPRTRSPQPGPAPGQSSALADRISELLPQAGDQALMLHWLTGDLGHSPGFAAAASLYPGMAQHQQARRAEHGNPGPGDPATPRCDDSVTIRTCPACGQPFTPSGRRRWCSDACKQAACRRRATPPAPAPALPARRPRRPVTVYECGQCGLRALGRQRCDDCGKFMSAVGTGNLCPRATSPSPSGNCRRRMKTDPSATLRRPARGRLTSLCLCSRPGRCPRGAADAKRNELK